MPRTYVKGVGLVNQHVDLLAALKHLATETELILIICIPRSSGAAAASLLWWRRTHDQPLEAAMQEPLAKGCSNTRTHAPEGWLSAHLVYVVHQAALHLRDFALDALDGVRRRIGAEVVHLLVQHTRELHVVCIRQRLRPTTTSTTSQRARRTTNTCQRVELTHPQTADAAPSPTRAPTTR